MNDSINQQLPKATLKELLFWLVGRRKRFFVEGTSMFPTLQPGDVVLIKKKIKKLWVGDIVVCYHPKTQKKIIKRIQKKQPKNFFVIGDNIHQSSDSRSFGFIQKEDIIGIAKSVIRKTIIHDSS